MRYRMPPKAGRPEDANVIVLRRLLSERGWYTIKTHGSAMQAGLPDLLCWHSTLGFRMIEVKMETGRFTVAQKEEFHKISGYGGQIWVIEGKDPVDEQYLIQQLSCLNSKGNWYIWA